MKPALFHEDAEAELKAAVAFYETNSAGLGLDLAARTRPAVREIDGHPEGFPFHRVPPIRKHHLRRFRSTVFDLVLPDTVWILALAPNRQRPDLWRSRLV